MTGYVCRTCGALHEEEANCFLFELPLSALDVPEEERETRIEASSDQCVVDGKHFFILGNLDVPVRGQELFVRWTAWASLSEKNFERATELWRSPGRESEPAYFGWLNNQIPGYNQTLSIKTLVHTQPVGVRPRIEVVEEGHELWREQREGITQERYRELLEKALHD